MKPGIPPTCQCGTCRTCYLRLARRRYYASHTEEVKQKARETAAARRANTSREVSDAELDRRALVLMGRLDAR
jgi:hypothetical protein